MQKVLPLSVALHVQKLILKSSIPFFNATGAVPLEYVSVILLITTQNSENHVACEINDQVTYMASATAFYGCRYLKSAFCFAWMP